MGVWKKGKLRARNATPCVFSHVTVNGRPELLLAPTTTTTATMSKSEPLSVDALLQKQKAEKEATAKVYVALSIAFQVDITNSTPQPKFLTKEERAAIAIAKRTAEIREAAAKQESARQAREQLERDAEAVRAPERSGRYGGNTRSQSLSSLTHAVTERTLNVYLYFR